MHPGGTREGRGSWQLEPPTEKLLSDSHTRPVPMGRVVGLEKSGKGRNEGESRQRLLGISLLAGGIREGVVGKSRRWCSYESCLSFLRLSFHTSSAYLNRWKSGNIMTYRQRERWAKSKCMLKCSLHPLRLVLGFWEKSPDSSGESEEHTVCFRSNSLSSTEHNTCNDLVLFPQNNTKLITTIFVL